VNDEEVKDVVHIGLHNKIPANKEFRKFLNWSFINFYSVSKSWYLVYHSGDILSLSAV
jgi:hypothetical protein